MQEGIGMAKREILIVDNSKFNRELLMDILGDGYCYWEASSGEEAISCLYDHPNIALVLLDVVMPHINGFEVLERMNQYRWIDEVPVIAISTEHAGEFMEQTYNLGVTDYLQRPFHALVVRRRVENTLKLYDRQKHLTRLLSEQTREKEKIRHQLVGVFGSVIEADYGDKSQHVLHVRMFTERLLHQLAKKTDRYHLTETEIQQISMASALHDIGKRFIPKEILEKTTRLTAEEYGIVKTHTTAGAAFLKELPGWKEEPFLDTAYEICLWHHERWDGKGYPDGLRGDAIPISAQAVSLADAYDALISPRWYKPALDHDTALRMILKGDCGAFNPLLIKCLIEISKELSQRSEPLAEEVADPSYYRSLSAEVLRKDGLPGEALPQRVLNYEREKKKFFASQCGGIQFEYDVPKNQLSVINWMEQPECRRITDTLERVGEMQLLGSADCARLKRYVAALTPEMPECCMDTRFSISGEEHAVRVTVRVIWSDEKAGQRIFVIGLLQPQDIEHSGGILMEINMGNAPQMAEYMKHLQKIYDMVRLVDPRNSVVLKINEDGSLMPLERDCHSVWGRGTKCRDCLSGRAFTRKGLVSDLQFTETNAYHVLAQYVEINGQACVLELVSRLENGRWLDNDGKRLVLEDGRAEEEQIYRDPLTGAYSRHYLEYYLPHRLGRDSVMLIDVDDFKDINDIYGHLAGDQALCSIADAISSCIQETDVLIRYGGDEFLLLMPDIPEREIPEKAQEIREAVRKATVQGYPELHMSVSVGGVYGESRLERAIVKADRRMYRDKARKERNRGDTAETE